MKRRCRLGIPSARKGAGLARPGDAHIGHLVRSLIQVGGTRPGRNYWRKKDRIARKQGYGSGKEMVAAVALAIRKGLA